MISEKSWDTEDWSSDAENSVLHHRKTLHSKKLLKYKIIIVNYYNISQLYPLNIFDQINAVLESIGWDFLKNTNNFTKN